MTARRFSTGSRFLWNNVLYEVRRLLPENNINIANMETGEMDTVAFILLYRDLIEGKIRFEGEGASSDKPPSVIDWSDISEECRQIIEFRKQVIEPLVDIPPQERKVGIERRVEEYRKKFIGKPKTMLTAISEASIYRWLRAYEKSGRDIRALLPKLKKRGNRKKVRIDPDVNRIVETTIDDLAYLQEFRSIDYIHREVTLRIDEENHYRPSPERLKHPSRATIGRRIRGRDIEGLLVAKRGKKEARREMEQVGEGIRPQFPLERVEIDHTKTDLFVIDEQDYLPLGRLTFTHCLEAFTRYPLGLYLGFEPPSYLTVMECLYHAILPKENVQEMYGTKHDWSPYGIPYTLVIDNAPEFVGGDLEDACLLLGVNIERTPVDTPEFKATVERMIETLNKGVLHTIPGTTFSNLWERGDYDSLKNACVTFDRLDQIVHHHVVDIYAEDFHQGLRGIPARRWEALTKNGFFPRVPKSGDDLRILLGRVEYRTIQRYGIEFETLRYNCTELSSVRTLMKKYGIKEIKCKYHPGDLSRIYVFDPFDERYIEVPALAQSYTQGLSLWKHKIIRSYARKHSDKVDLAALGEAQRKIQDIVDQSLNEKKLRGRAIEARWQHSGKTPSLKTSHSSSTITPQGEDSEQAESSPSTLTEQQGDSQNDEFVFNLSKLTSNGWGVINPKSIYYDDDNLDFNTDVADVEENKNE